MSMSQLDPGQIIKSAFDDATGSHKVKVVSDSAVNLSVISTHVIDFSDIPNNAGAPFEITASLPAACKQIVPQEQTGRRLQLRIGAATGTLKVYLAAGQDTAMDCDISLGTRVTVRSDETAPISGTLVITFLG